MKNKYNKYKKIKMGSEADKEAKLCKKGDDKSSKNIIVIIIVL